MSDNSGLLFILGAGFTKAFAPAAPLLRDDFGLPTIISELGSLRHARRILQTEIDLSGEKSDFERLLTRLDTPLPYDSEDVSAELRVLKSRLIRTLIEKILLAKRDIYKDDLLKFAKYCIENQSSCITFNYDDILDEELVNARKLSAKDKNHSIKYWHPDGGYGFFCLPSEGCLMHSNSFMDNTCMYLIKLHGSLNWRIRKGHQNPLSIDSIVHHEFYARHQYTPEFPEFTFEQIERHLEPDPFIIAPVMNKSALGVEPVTKLLWNLAYHHLATAREIIFLGYSLPSTDFMATSLFAEAIKKEDGFRPTVTVVNIWGENDRDKFRIQDRYREALKPIVPNFVTSDVREWIVQNAQLNELN